MVLWFGLQCVIEEFSDHTYLLLFDQISLPCYIQEVD